MGSMYPTSVCKLCGGRIEGHRVFTDKPVRGKIQRTTCAAAGALLDKSVVGLFPGETPEPWEARMARECQQRREAARSVWQEPLRENR